MFRFANVNSNSASKDARTCAPSVNCAKNSYNVAIITGIAMAMSVFLYAIVSIIGGIMIFALNAIIIPVIIISIINIIMICVKILKLNMYAKLYAI